MEGKVYESTFMMSPKSYFAVKNTVSYNGQTSDDNVSNSWLSENKYQGVSITSSARRGGLRESGRNEENRSIRTWKNIKEMNALKKNTVCKILGF